MAVVGGLSHSSLARLTRTASRVPADSQRTLAERFKNAKASKYQFCNLISLVTNQILGDM